MDSKTAEHIFLKICMYTATSPESNIGYIHFWNSTWNWRYSIRIGGTSQKFRFYMHISIDRLQIQSPNLECVTEFGTKISLLNYIVIGSDLDIAPIYIFHRFRSFDASNTIWMFDSNEIWNVWRDLIRK